jgi:hypothetical protein
VHSVALLTLAAEPQPPERRGRAALVFQGIVPLRGSAADDLRADVFAAGSEVPPANADNDSSLRRVRRAALFLRDWRHLIALARLPSDVAAPARALLDLARVLAAGTGSAAEEAFAGGPSAADVKRLGNAEDRRLLAALRNQDGEDIDNAVTRRWFSATRGPGELTVAELAAAHQTTRSDARRNPPWFRRST